MDFVANTIMSIEEYMRLFDEKGAFEFIEGEILVVAQKKFGDNYRANKLSEALSKEAQGVSLVETPFVLSDAENPNWIRGSRIPDVMFIKQARFDAYCANTPDWDDKPLALVPDLAVEFISPTDKYADVIQKIDTYLQDGVQIVWLINSQNRTVVVYQSDSKQNTVLNLDDRLEGGTVLPGFEIAVAQIFTPVMSASNS